jgi:LPXTG-site transpeptidase (sortase) family protein
MNALSSNGPGGINITNTTPASATLNVVGAGAPSVSKSFSPNNIWAGGVSQLTISITNGANVTLTGASITDPLPANVFLANPVSATLTGCGGSATVTAVSGGSSVTLNNGTIPSGTTCTITVNVTSNVQGAYTNRIPAQALQNNQGLTNPTAATARLNVRELGLTKRFSPSTLSPGGTTTLIITLQNPNTTPFTGVNVTDNLPSPLVVANPPPTATSTCGVPPGSVSTTTNSVTLTGGTIPAGSITTPGTCTISVPVTAPAGSASGQVTNTIPAGGVTTDQGVGNLTGANGTVTISGTDLTGIKSFSPSSIPAGGNSRLRLDFFAPSDTDLTNFTFTDNLPAGVVVSNSTPAAVTGCGPAAVLNAPTGATTISLTNGFIPATQRCRVDVWVTSNTPNPPGIPYANTIPPTNITNDQNRIPTSALTANLTVTGGAAVSISLVKDFFPLLVTGGASSTLSIELINPGNTGLTGIAFTDTMPSNMILYNPVNPNVGACGGTITGTPGANTFSFSGGSLPPLGRCLLTLNATITVNGNLTNTIDAGAVTTDQGVTNADPTSATLTNLPGASIGKFFSPNPIPAGSYSLLTITIVNTGNLALTGLGLSDSLPPGLTIAGGSVPAPVNNCGGTFTAVPGTQLVELTGGSLAGNASCTMVVAVTGTTPGDYENTIPAGALRTDPSINVTNSSPATDTLTISGTAPPVGGGGPGGGGNNTRRRSTATTNAALIPVTAGFAPGIVTKLDAASRSEYESTGLSLEIPVIKVKTSVVGVEGKQGNWDISWLQDQVGWLTGTAYPTWRGNSVLTGHVVNADGKPGVFYNLKALGIGEYIFVYNSGYRYTYKVLANSFIQPDDKNIMKHEEKSHLTLITCDTYDEKTAKYLRYVMVQAELVDIRLVK